MKIGSVYTWFIAAAMIMLLALSGPALAEKPTINLLSAPFGGSAYVMSTAMQEIAAKNNAPFVISHTESPGVKYNFTILEEKKDKKKNTIIGASPTITWLANSGKPPFKKKMSQDILNVANYNVMGRWFITRKPEIKELTDLKGKKIGLGNKQQTFYGQIPLWDITLGAGVPEKSLTLEWIGQQAGAKALADGLLDATVVGGYLNPMTNKLVIAPFFAELVATVGRVYHVNVGEEAVKNVQKAIGLPGFVHTLAPNTVAGQDQPLTVGMSLLCWAASREFPEDQMYELVKLLINHSDEFASYHALGKILTKKMLCWGQTKEILHPGAYRAYKEAGLMD